MAKSRIKRCPECGFLEIIKWGFRDGHQRYKCKNCGSFFCNSRKDISALQVAELYKNRWQVELFFKWLKQHLKVKKFWCTTENAVRIQIYAAICAYCLVAIVQKDMQLDRSTYEVLQILSISLTDKTHLQDLFDKTKFQDFKELSDPNEPNLFNF